MTTVLLTCVLGFINGAAAISKSVIVGVLVIYRNLLFLKQILELYTILENSYSQKFHLKKTNKNFKILRKYFALKKKKQIFEFFLFLLFFIFVNMIQKKIQKLFLKINQICYS